MGEKGRGYGGGIAGIITMPVHVYFNAQELIILQHIEHAMHLYKAEHDGTAPEDPRGVHGPNHQRKQHSTAHAADRTSLRLRSENTAS